MNQPPPQREGRNGIDKPVTGLTWAGTGVIMITTGIFAVVGCLRRWGT